MRWWKGCGPSSPLAGRPGATPGSRSATLLRALERDGRLSVPLNGEEVILSRDEVVARMHEAQGYAAEGQAGEFAVLETTLTPDLVLEGQARELVHQIQNLRKDAGLAV